MISFCKYSFIETQPEPLVCIFHVITRELSIQDKTCIVNNIKISVIWSFTGKKKITKLPLEDFLQISKRRGKKRILIEKYNAGKHQ